MTVLANLLESLLTASPLAGLGGHWELIVIFLIILLLFGKRLPGVARSLGQGISSFKKGLNEPLEEEERKQEEALKAKSDGESAGA